MAGKRTLVAGTVSDQSQTVIHIRGLQFRGELRQLQSQEGEDARKRYYQRFPAARVMSAPVWAIDIDEMKFTDNRLGFGKNCPGDATAILFISKLERRADDNLYARKGLVMK